MPASRRSLMACAVATALAGAPLSALAQLEEVVVTAQKKSESLQDAPLAVTAFSEDMLEDLGAFDAVDLAEYTPNVNIVPTLGSGANIRMEIRGMSTAEPSLTIDPKVGIYLDGAYIARNAGAVFDIVDLERVEIMRGPQGTLWGKNTTGGAVNLVSKKPQGELGFKQLVSVGNHGHFRSVSTLDTPTFGTAAAKFTYMNKQYDGWAKNHGIGEKNLGSEDVDAFRAALSWEITEQFFLDYSYDRTKNDLVATPLQITAVTEGAADKIGTYDIATETFYPYNALVEMQDVVNTDGRVEDFELDGQGKEKVDISGHNLTLALELNAVTLRSITSYRKYEADSLEGLDLDGGSWGFNGEALPVFHSTNFKDQDQFQQELQALGNAFDDRLDYVVGLYYFEEQGREDNPWNATIYQAEQPVLLRGIPLGNWYGIDNKSAAAFGNFTYRPSDSLYLVLGVRYTDDQKGLELYPEDPRLTEERRFKEDWQKWTGAFTLGYQPSDELNAYFKYAQGFNAGVYGIPSDPTAADIQPADPEELDTYEIGIKSELLDRSMRLNAALFYTDADNLQVTAFIDGNRTVVNSGTAEIYGGEVELLYMPKANWQFDANYGYRKTERDTLEDIADPSGKHSGRLGAGYNTPAGDWGLFNIRADATYQDSVEYSSNGSADVDSRWLLSARAGLSEISAGPGELRIALWGKNLLDEEYGVHGTDFGLDSGYGFAGITYGAPRSYGIDLTWEF